MTRHMAQALVFAVAAVCFTFLALHGEAELAGGVILLGFIAMGALDR